MELRTRGSRFELESVVFDQRNLGAMSTGIAKKRLGIAKCFQMQIG